jgi:hypothetical protein
MFFSKLKIGLVVSLLAGAITIGTGALVGQERATRKDGGPPSTTTKRANPPDADQTTVQATGDQYVKAARDRLQAQKAFFEEGRITIDRYLDASRQLMDAEQLLADLRTRPADRAAAAQAHLGRVKQIEQHEGLKLEAGTSTRADLAEARLARMQAELIVAREAGPDRPGRPQGQSTKRVEGKAADEQAASRRIADLERRLGDLERKFDQLSKAPAATPLKSSPR